MSTSGPNPVPPGDPRLTWRNWESVAVRLDNLPHDASTYNIWLTFKELGNIISIDIFENPNGRVPPKGRIRFMPPPDHDFWSDGTWRMEMPFGRIHQIKVFVEFKHQNTLLIESPVRQGVQFPKRLKLKLSKLEIGVRPNEDSFFAMQSFKGSDALEAVLDVQDQRLLILFDCKIQDSALRKNLNADVLDGLERSLFRLRIPFVELSQIWESFEEKPKAYSLMTILRSPPMLHRKLPQIELTFRGSNTQWRDSDTWYRQVSISHNPLRQADTPTNLRKSGQIIDIGRWNVFRITLAPEQSDRNIASLIRDILKDHNITVQDGNHFTQLQQSPPSVWRWIDYHNDDNPKASSLMQNAYDENLVQLSFLVRYQLEVCLSHGLISEFAIPTEFLLELGKLGEAKAVKLLEHVANSKKTYLDPMQIFKLQYLRGVSDAKIPAYCCFMRTARVTPTTIYLNTPTVDLSNRVTRRYAEYSDRFLRVRFTDEITQGGIYACTNDTNDEIFTHVKRTLANGITIGDRHYEFLAFGNSQLREHGAYFFAPLPHLKASHIRAWMGQFNSIRNVAKHAARLGQCFSTTRAVIGTPVDVRTIPDIVRGKHNFTDGVGKISKFLATMTMNELKISTLNGKPPSAFQFRLGGCKGLLVVSSDPEPREIHMRKSQRKFEAQSSGLEVIRWSQYNPASLNRQIILVLTALEVPGAVIIRKLKEMIQNVDGAMNSDLDAAKMLKKYVDPNEITLQIAKLVSDGFRRTNEPFVNSMLQLWKAWHLKYLKEKARIVIEKGAILFGCVDELNVLQGHDDRLISAVFPKYNDDMKRGFLPQIFLQICRPENGGRAEIIEGLCIIARNPSLHPGDIRVVSAIDRPELHHLYDIVVFPQKGSKDLASMCSGGDLDGDDFLVIWDPDLIPKSDRWFLPPMNHTGTKAPELDQDVTVDDITSFFTMYLKTDNLPRIATSHMAQADFHDDGILNPKCLKLAKLHSNAVDYCKTGAASRLSRDLEPFKWPHFMERKGRHTQIYHSKRVLGKLYDFVRLEDFKPNLKLPFDKRILKSPLVPASESYLDFARNLKADYDCAIRRIMAQYGIKTEFEVWSSFVLDHNFLMRDYKMYEGLGSLSSRLRDGFRQACFDKVGGRSLEDIAPLVVALYRATYEATTEAVSGGDRDKKASLIDAQEDDFGDDGDDSDGDQKSPEYTPLISFPWIFSDLLGDIATGRFKLGPKEGPNAMAGPTAPKPRVLLRAEVDDVLMEFHESENQRPTPLGAGLGALPLAKKMVIEDNASGVDLQSASAEADGRGTLTGPLDLVEEEEEEGGQNFGTVADLLRLVDLNDS